MNKAFSFIGIGILAFSFASFSGGEKGEKVEGEYAAPGLVAYAASYSSDPVDEPNYITEYNKTFQYLNISDSLTYYRGDSIKVGIIDSGINYDHEDFKENSVTKVKGQSKGYTYSTNWTIYTASSNGYSCIDDSHGHGTNVAATVAAAINGIGGLGLAPNVELYVYKVTNTENGYEFGAIQLALNDAVTLGLDVVNMSFQSYEKAVSYGTQSMGASSGCSTILSSYLNYAYNHGVTLVGAAGNFNINEKSYPGSNNHVINVGSLNQTGTDKADFSNYGESIDLVAPGYVNVAGRNSNSYYKDTSGTSFSAPLVTAAIALYKQQNPTATPAEIEQALYDSCDPIDDSGSPYENWAGHGALNVAKLLGLVGDANPTGVSIYSSKSSLKEGEKMAFSATVSPTNASDKTVAWTSSNTSVATIDANGILTAKHYGQTTITATTNTGGFTATKIITVNPIAASLTVDPDPVTVEVDDSQEITVTATYSDSSEVELDTSEYYATSLDESICTIEDGVITGIGEGETYVLFEGPDGSDYELEVTVNPSSATISTTPYKETIFNTTNNSAGASSYTNSWSNTTSGFKVDITNANNANNAWNYIKIGDKNNPITGTIITNTAIDKRIGRVSIVIDSITTTYVNSMKLYSSSNGTSWTEEGSFAKETGTKSVDISSPTANKYYKIEISCAKGTNNGIVAISGVKFFNIVSPLSSITVKTAPSKTAYETGEYFNPTGLVITATYSDSSTEDIAYSQATSEYFTFTPNTSTALATNNEQVTISYGGKSTSQAISVTAPKTLTSISISEYKTSFVEGDTFVFGGTVTANYENGSPENVTSQATYTGYTMTTLGQQEITVSYTCRGTTKNAKYNITINQGTLSSIAISGQTTNYELDSSFSFDGTLTATFNNGYQKAFTPTSVSSPDMSTTGNKEVIISLTYNGLTKSTSYNISVTDPYDDDTLLYSTVSVDCTATSLTLYTDSVSSNQKITAIFAKGNGSNSPSKFTTDNIDHIRAYAKNTITINSSKTNIAAIKFTFVSGEGSNAISANSGTYSNGTWTGTALTSSVVFTIGGTSGHRRVATIEVSYYSSANYVKDFSNKLSEICDPSGLTPPSETEWNTIGTKCTNSLFDTDKKALKDTIPNKTGTKAQKAMFYYDLVVRVYGYNNFLGKTVNNANNYISLLGNENSATIYVVIILSTSALLSLLIYIKRKRKI